MMKGATRHKITIFPEVVSLDQNIHEVIPLFWILATAMSNHATSQERREDSARYITSWREIWHTFVAK